MDAVLRAILHDQYAGHAGVYRFDPATGRRTPLTGLSRSTAQLDLDAPATPGIEIEHEPGQSDTPDTGA
jgi:hypothetical protein